MDVFVPARQATYHLAPELDGTMDMPDLRPQKLEEYFVPEGQVKDHPAPEPDATEDYFERCEEALDIVRADKKKILLSWCGFVSWSAQSDRQCCT